MKSISKSVKRMISVVLAVSMAMLMAVTSDLFAMTANAEPEMDEYDRIIYHIDSVQDLYAIEDNMNGHYILDTDLDISSECIGNGWIPIGANDKYELVKMFRGLFDGNGHTITGMNISIADLGVSHEGAMYLGLFASVSGTVKNLTISGGEITMCIPAYCEVFAGSICGNLPDGVIINCHNKISISTYVEGNYASYTGGITGDSGQSIENCSNSGSITAFRSNETDSSKDIYVGGICGGYSIVQRSYNAGLVYASAGKSVISGIVGPNGYAKDCYNCGDIAANGNTNVSIYGIGSYTAVNCYTLASNEKYTGAIMNSEAGTSSYSEDNYYQVKHDDMANATTPLRLDQMKEAKYFAGFDFNNVWVIDPASAYQYPQLRGNMNAGIGTGSNETPIIPDDIELVVHDFTIYGNSVSLGEKIGIKFYIGTSEDGYIYDLWISQSGYESDYIELTDDLICEVNGKKMYVIDYFLNAKEINDEVSITITDKNNIKCNLVSDDKKSYGTEYSISASDYFVALKKINSADAKLIALIDSVMDYGNCAQEYFNYSIDSVGEISDKVDKVSIEDISTDNYRKEGMCPEIKYAGSSLLLESKVTIRHYFSVDNSSAFDKYNISFKVLSDRYYQPIELKHLYDNVYYIDIDSVKPVDFDTYYAVIIENNDNDLIYGISYSVEAYIYDAIRKSADEKLVSLVKALYLYDVAANAYAAK